MKAIKAAYDAFVSGLELIAIQNRTGISAIEAAQSWQSEAELVSLGTDARGLQEAAITLAKAGITQHDDIEGMVRHWYGSRNHFRQIAAMAERYANE